MHTLKLVAINLHDFFSMDKKTKFTMASMGHFLPRDVIYASHHKCLSVSVSCRPMSHPSILSKWLKLGSCKQLYIVKYVCIIHIGLNGRW